VSHQISKTKNLKVGDLVTHILYGKEWIGMITKFMDPEHQSQLNKEKALIQIQPGTKFDGFFNKNSLDSNRITQNLGYVSVNWLFKIEIKDGEVRPARDKT
jgi:hypothetical protein